MIFFYVVRTFCATCCENDTVVLPSCLSVDSPSSTEESALTALENTREISPRARSAAPSSSSAEPTPVTLRERGHLGLSASIQTGRAPPEEDLAPPPGPAQAASSETAATAS